MEDPVKVDVLKDEVIETAFPIIQRLLKIYICTPQSEAVVEREFPKMNLILTKKLTAPNNDTLDALMRISYWKTKLNAYKTKEIIDTWKHKKDRRILSWVMKVTFSRTAFEVEQFKFNAKNILHLVLDDTILLIWIRF